MASQLPASVAAEVQRILDAEARRRAAGSATLKTGSAAAEPRTTAEAA